MVQHTYFLRFTGVHLPTHPMQSFAKVQAEFQNPWMIAFYAAGIIAASWHFSYGLWLFAAKWGITVPANGAPPLRLCLPRLALGLVSIGAASMYGFLSTPNAAFGFERDGKCRDALVLQSCWEQASGPERPADRIHTVWQLRKSS
jgi:succinate dehydrogenase / fumarate reductase, cytochrome b subunit